MMTQEDPVVLRLALDQSRKDFSKVVEEVKILKNYISQKNIFWLSNENFFSAKFCQGTKTRISYSTIGVWQTRS